MKEIPLTQGKFAKVDDADFDWLNQWKWTCNVSREGLAYAIRDIWKDGICTRQRMHRIILGINEPRIIVDHKNGNGLDNRRSNLRTATNAQNTQNSKLRSTNTSGYRGIYWSKRGNKWTAAIRSDGTLYHLGSFSTKEEAASAYNDAARKHHGEFARLNMLD